MIACMCVTGFQPRVFDEPRLSQSPVAYTTNHCPIDDMAQGQRHDSALYSVAIGGRSDVCSQIQWLAKAHRDKGWPVRCCHLVDGLPCKNGPLVRGHVWAKDHFELVGGVSTCGPTERCKSSHHCEHLLLVPLSPHPCWYVSQHPVGISTPCWYVSQHPVGMRL
jgi:hypothetical protein